MKRVFVVSLLFGLIGALADNGVSVGNDRYIKNTQDLKRVQSDPQKYIQLRTQPKGSSGGGTSKVQANENVNLNLVNKSEIKGSLVGMRVKASGGSEVKANRNTNLNLVNKSEVEDSTIGMSVEAE